MADIISTGVNVNVMISEFSAIAPKPPAAFDVRLYNAAYQHSLNMIACNCQTHTGQETLVKNSGFDYRLLRGNVFSYAKSAIHCHAALNIDWAGTNNPGDQYGMQPGRGHRVAIMSIDADTYVRKLYNVGIAIIAHNGSYPNAGPFVMTGNYAEARDTSWGAPVPNHYNRFIVGTVWRDSNCNGMYNPGEGIANVMVQPDHGKYYAITSNSGGYAIPIESPGNYQVDFSGGFLSGQGKKNVEIGEISVLLDLNTTAPVASFHAAGPTAGSRPFMVAFIDTSGADITSRQWDFGDGTKSTDQNPTHTYTQDGKYSISLMVNTTCGSITETKTNYILVAEQGADVNGDLNINLADAILALQISVNYMGVDIRPDGAPDVNGDGKTGIEEAIYIMRWLSN
jgi:PKD repeat protein